MGNLRKFLTEYSPEAIEALIASLPFENVERVVNLIIARKIRTPKDLAEAMDISLAEANALQSDSTFNKILIGKALLQQKSNFAMKSLNVLDDYVDPDKYQPEIVLKAIKQQSETLGFTKNEQAVVNISLENVLTRAKEKQIDIDITIPGLE